MSYLEVENKDFYNDINTRKEFIESLIDESDKDNYYIDGEFKKENKMILNNYQKFISNFINPNTKFSRLLLCHQTGSGKSITSLSTAINFIEIYKKERMLNLNENINSGMVYIVGFTKSIFKRELLSRPEFGIISSEEIHNMNELKKQIMKYNLDKDKATLKELKIKYSIRLKSRKGNGYFEFIGYKKLVNKLLIKVDMNYKLQLSSIKDEDELNIYIEKNILKLNTSFLESFNKSLIICDEIHNVYNSVDINNWGLCLKIIFNYHASKNSIRVLLLSATPINNKPVEIISLLELLNNNLRINKSEIFDNNTSQNISENGLKLIKKYIMGKISYLKDMNLDLYPSKEIMGEKIPGIDYLNFVKCPMSNLHFQTYSKVSNEYVEIKNLDDYDEKVDKDEEDNNVDIEEIKSITKSLKQYPINLELNNRYLNDFVVPDPENNSKKPIGLFIKNDIIKNISNATKKWKSEYEVDIIKNDKLLRNTLTGNFLIEENIKKYSTKYYNMLNIIKDCIVNDKGKIFLYHNFVQVSGINFIGEILKVNGVLELNDLPVKHSRCGVCYDFKFKHDDIKKSGIKHEFKPIRFISVSSLLSKNIIEKQLEQFNMDSNMNGDDIKIILGSQAIKESYDLKAVQNVVILHQPVNISTLIQIFGRAIRKNSHINLPIEKRKVRIFVLVSTMPKFIQDKSKSYIYTFEEMKYKYKINIYKVIQKINDIFIENAIDLNINYNINFPEGTKNSQRDIYDIKHVDKKSLIKVDYSKLNLQTFQSYYYNDEINMCKYIIKRLLIEYSKVWTFKDLFEAVKSPYFKINFNTILISEYSFIIALDFLVYEKSNINILNKEDSINNSVVNNLFDHNEKFIYDVNNDINILLYINEYYILVPYNKNNKSLNFYDGIKLDYDILFRNNKKEHVNEINLNEYVKTNNLNDFKTIKTYFINKYSDVKIENMFNIIIEYDFDFHLEMIEELIDYFFNLYTNVEYSKNINHDLYMNLLYFYNKFNIIIFANNLDKELNDLYDKYTISTKNLTYSISDDSDMNYNYNNLVSSLEDEYDNNNTKNNLQFSYYKKAIAETDNFLSNKKKKIKVFDYLLCVGHIFGKEIRFYNPKGFWFNKLTYGKINMKFKDNDGIIGYLEKTNIGFDINFKLKINNNTKKMKDRRKEISGLNCLNIDKPDLYKICKNLKIDISKIKNRKTSICDLIKFELIRLELEERKKNSNIRYFYFYWEEMPK
jgi:hypothetical protein